MLLIFGGRGDHDDHEHDNLTGVDSTPVNCGEDNHITKSDKAIQSKKIHSTIQSNNLA